MAFRIQKKWHWLVAVAAVFVPGIVTGALTLPFTFSAGQPIRASEVNANFEALRAQLAGTPARPTVGTLTLAGIATPLPIRKFTESVTIPTSGAGATAKPTFSDVQVVLDVGASDPQLNSDVSNHSPLTSADVAVGNFALHLTGVALDHLTVGPAQAGVAQETLGMTFQTVQWSWQVGTGPASVVSYDTVQSVGGGSSVKSFSYGYFAPGVVADATYLSVSGYTHDITCPPAAKCAQGPLSVQKAVGSETLDELGLATGAPSALKVALAWFQTAGTSSNTLQLSNASVVGVALTTNDDGTFTESVDFSYGQITWLAGAQQTTFVVAGQAT
jgi:type VI protein secretion system component Hcp